ncbi:MAG: tryptophan-rich sensory protein [Acidobacteria bacterium]|nr:tryptophan-rich sensory protein [Acidobacteriota bacterium]
MKITDNSSEKIKQFLVVAATIGTIVFNYFAATGFAGGVATNVVSDKTPTNLTPAGYAFAIWSLIYLGLIAFSIYQALPAQLDAFRALRRTYIVSCVANCVWLYLWSRELLVACVGVIVVLLATLAYINIRLVKTASNGEYWFVKFPFGIYFGWVTAATILNVTIALAANGVQFPDPTANAIGAVLIFVAAALGVIVRLRLTNYFYPLAIAWALTAIAVKQSRHTLIVAAAAVGVIACLIAALSFVMNMPHTEEPAAE